MNRFLIWGGKQFPYHARLCVESILLNEPDSTVSIYLIGNPPDQDEWDADGENWKKVTSYQRVECKPAYMDTVWTDWPELRPCIESLQRLVGKNHRPTAFVYRAFSNFLRYVLLYQYGGIYLDTDTLVHKSLSDWHDVDFIGQEGRGSYLFNTAVLGSVKHSPWMGAVLHHLPGYPMTRWGPWMMVHLLQHRQALLKSLKVIPPEAIYFIPSQQSHRLFLDSDLRLPDGNRIVHLVQSINERFIFRMTPGRPQTAVASDNSVFRKIIDPIAARAVMLPVTR